MIDLNTYKKHLIKSGLTNLTEEEIVRLRDQQDQMAEVFFVMWSDELKKKETKV